MDAIGQPPNADQGWATSAGADDIQTRWQRSSKSSLPVNPQAKTSLYAESHQPVPPVQRRTPIAVNIYNDQIMTSHGSRTEFKDDLNDRMRGGRREV